MNSTLLVSANRRSHRIVVMQKLASTAADAQNPTESSRIMKLSPRRPHGGTREVVGRQIVRGPEVLVRGYRGQQHDCHRAVDQQCAAEPFLVDGAFFGW